MKPWTFVYVADIQPGSPRSYRFNPGLIKNWEEARDQIREINPELILVGGDLTRDGGLHRWELEDMKREMDRFSCPVHVIPGNMDTGNKHTRVEGLFRRSADQCTDLELNVTSAQLQQFAEVVGPLWWSVEHRNVRFSGLADVVLNSGLPEETAFWKWADSERRKPKPAQHIWILHYPVFVDRPDEPNWRIDDPAHYSDWYFSIDQPARGRLMDLFHSTGATLVISGHVHCYRALEMEGIRFVIAPATSFGQWGDRWPDGQATPGFLRYDVSDAGLRETFVPLRRVHQLPGYGPGGHPAPHMRNYAMAWEK